MLILIKPVNFVILLLMLLVFFYASSQPAALFAHNSEKENVVVIHVDEKGYEPSKITIHSGTEVIFENVGSEDQWPATDNHPTHTSYDGTSLVEHCGDGVSKSFDSCGPVSTGETWSFVFEKIGTFSYHDHLWPHLDGEIVVEGGDPENGKEKGKNFFTSIYEFFRQFFIKISSFFVSDDEELVLNSGNTENLFYENLKTRYETIVLEKDAREAILALQETSSRDSNVFALCHDILHEIGHVAFQKYGSFGEAVTYQTDFCNSGYIHGIFESYFETVDDPLVGLAEQCNEYASHGGRQFDLWQCHHGVGHGFMYLTGGDLDESLELCIEGLGTGGGSSCQNGVLMEVFNLEVLAKENSYIDPDNPFLTCSTRDTVKADCYLYVPTYLSQTKNMDYSDIFDECDNVEIGYKSICINGVGSEAMKRNMDDPDSVFALCRQAGSFIKQEACVFGVAGMYMNQNASYAAGKELCEQAPKDFRDSCNSAVQNREDFFR